MAQKKEILASTDKKPKAKVQDLSPKKDAKGGGGKFALGGGHTALGGGKTALGGGKTAL